MTREFTHAEIREILAKSKEEEPEWEGVDELHDLYCAAVNGRGILALIVEQLLVEACLTRDPCPCESCKQAYR